MSANALGSRPDHARSQRSNSPSTSIVRSWTVGGCLVACGAVRVGSMHRRLVVAVLAVAVALLAAAPARAVTIVSLDNTLPSQSEQARTVYAVTFTTANTLPANGTATLKFPAGTTLNYNGYEVADLDAGGATIGYCDPGNQSQLTVTCHVDAGKSLPAGHRGRLTLHGVSNPPYSAAAPPPLQLTTSAEPGQQSTAGIVVKPASKV